MLGIVDLYIVLLILYKVSDFLTTDIWYYNSIDVYSVYIVAMKEMHCQAY